ncbi:GGDEF domain-containing protein [uncultured Selenomonas sp.]|uniref:GGDEF domain-containing protein n=1 Tax=uncultured Selenomonas sp. TaxID=159275 RepID=UPI0028F08D4B|nr:GGDEF domain-containing protein [uncultured Selenomonas sp.]
MQRILAFLRSNILTLLCIALLTGASGAAWYLLATPIDRSIQAEYAVFEGNPAYNDIIGFHAGAMDWQPYDYPAPPPMPRNTTTVYLSWQIPFAARFSNDHVLFATTNQNVYVYVDDELVYMHGDWNDLTGARGRALHYIHLDQNIAGKRLTILLNSGYPNWLGSIDYFMLGASETFLRSLSLSDAIYISSLSVTIALIVFLTMDLVWRGAKEHRRRIQLYIIGYLASFFLWTTGTSSFFPRIYGIPGVWWEIHLIMLYIMPMFCTRITQDIVSPRYIEYTRTIMKIFGIVFATATITEIAGLNGYMNLLFLFYPLLLIGSLVLIYTLIRSNWVHHPACRYACFAMTAMVIFGGIDAVHFAYHRLSAMLSTTVFSIYASIPFIFYTIREQMVRDAALAQENEHLVRELKISQNEAQRDYLTGAYNRHQLDEGFAAFSALSSERGFKFSFAIFDIDHFKSVNDTKGHLAGDAILRQIADTIHEEIDRRHLFIRYGGDEFILLALHYDLDAMVAFCEHLRHILEQRLDGVTLSFGVSTWHGKKDRLRALIDRADRALYLSKEKGRNTVSAENEEGAA